MSHDTRSNQMLAGLDVLEVGDDAAVRFCGWLLGRNGARVVRAAADAATSATPCTDAFLDVDKTVGPVVAQPTADILLAHRRDFEHLPDRDSIGIVAVVDDYAPTGPYRDWLGTPVTLVSHGGAARYTRTAAGEPVFGFGHVFDHIAGLYLYSAVVAAVGAPRTSAQREVAVSKFEAVVSSLPYLTTQVEYNGTTSVFEQSGPRFVSPCRDGWVVVYAGGRWEDIAALLDDPALLIDERFVELSARFENVDDLRDVIAEWSLARTVAAACEAGTQHNVAIARARHLHDVVADEELHDNGFLAPVALGAVAPRLPYTVSLSPATAAPREAAGPLPLSGITVLDLSHVWSGPHATRLLAALGAEVVKLEGPRRTDVLRGNPGDLASRYPDLEPTDDFRNRNAWFNTVNTDKSSLVVDLKDPRGRDIVLDLAARADVVVANFRAGVLDRMGLGMDELRRRRPDVVLVEMPGHMPGSRLAAAPAYGAQFEAASGACFLVGDESEPLLTGFALGDPVAGLFAAAAALTALEHRRRTGQGAHVQLAQAEGLITLFGEHVVAASAGVASGQPVNGAAGHAPHGIFPCAAPDTWIALSVADDAQWTALVELIGPAAADLVRHDHAWALAHPEEVRAVVTAWSSTLADVPTAARQLQERQVPAAPVSDGRDLVDDRQLSAGYLTPLRHPSVGLHRYPAFPVTFDGHRLAPRSAAPRLGEHTREVVLASGALDAVQVDSLVAEGVLVVLDEATPAGAVDASRRTLEGAAS